MLTREQVEHVAKLARLAISTEETALYGRQLSSILSYVEKLNELDTAAIQPTSHVLPLTNVTRADRARPSLAPDQALANAPDRAGDLFRVPKIISERE